MAFFAQFWLLSNRQIWSCVNFEKFKIFREFEVWLWNLGEWWQIFEDFVIYNLLSAFLQFFGKFIIIRSSVDFGEYFQLFPWFWSTTWRVVEKINLICLHLLVFLSSWHAWGGTIVVCGNTRHRNDWLPHDLASSEKEDIFKLDFGVTCWRRTRYFLHKKEKRFAWRIESLTPDHVWLSVLVLN